jgi:hypothetical protein
MAPGAFQRWMIIGPAGGRDTDTAQRLRWTGAGLVALIRSVAQPLAFHNDTAITHLCE